MVAAPGAGKRVEVVGWVLSLDAIGSFKFQSASTDKTGAIPVLASTPHSVEAGWPFIKCAANEALNLVTVTGKAFGVVAYRIVSV